MAKEVAARNAVLPPSSPNFDQVLSALRGRGLLLREAEDLFCHIKQLVDAAVHQHDGTPAKPWFACPTAILRLYPVNILGINNPVTLAAYIDQGQFAPRKIAAVLRTTSDELARSLGLGKDAVQRKKRIASDRTQRRLRQMVEILNKVEPRFGSALLAYAWYRSEPLAGFDGRTAMQLVHENRADDVLRYVDAVDAGIYA